MQSLLSLIDMSLTQFLLLNLVVLLAAVIRGFSGFGFGAILLTAGSLFMRPVDLVPVSLILEIAATIHMLGGIWRNVDWKVVAWMVLASLFTVPFAQMLLAALPVTTTRAIVSVAVFVLASMVFAGFKLQTKRLRTVYITGGLVSGVLNGVAAIGGIVCTLILLAIQATPAVTRATTSMYLLIANMGGVSLGYTADTGLFNETVIWRVVALLPILFIGILIGTRQFTNTDAQSWRLHAVRLVLILATCGILRVVYDLTLGSKAL